MLLHLVRNLGEVAHDAGDDAWEALAQETRNVVEESARSLTLEPDRARIRDAAAWAFGDQT